MVKFQALTWESKDTDDEHLISIFGKTMDGKSVCVTTEFAPYFFIKLPNKITAQRVQNIYSNIRQLKTTLKTTLKAALKRCHNPHYRRVMGSLLGIPIRDP